MINVHEKLALLLVPLVIGVATLDVRAETASTPAGFYRLDCLGNSDTIISIPFSRPETGFAHVQSIAGSTVTVKGTPGWSENQFVYAFGSQSNTYYLRLLAGAKEGSYYPIVANGTNSLTVSLGGDDLSSVTNDTRLLVVPYWTLGSAFPGGRGIIPSTSALLQKTKILIPNFSGAGINLSPAATYYYLGSANCWCRVNDSQGTYGTSNMNDVVLIPDLYFILRHPVTTNTVFTARGSVPMSKLSTPILTQPASKQDNFVALTRPVTHTLNESGLVQSGAFLSSTSQLIQNGDQLLVFDNGRIAQNKSPAATYYYLSSLSRWCRVNDSQGTYGTTDMGNEPVFVPGTGVIIRKKLGSVSTNWVNSPNY